MAKGRAWGNALGGYKFQRRGKGGKFGSGFTGSTPARSVNGLSKGQRRAGYLQGQQRKQRAKRAAAIAGVVTVGAAGGYLAYQNRGALQGVAKGAAQRLPKKAAPIAPQVPTLQKSVPKLILPEGMSTHNSTAKSQTSALQIDYKGTAKSAAGGLATAAAVTGSIVQVQNNVNKLKPQTQLSQHGTGPGAIQGRSPGVVAQGRHLHLAPEHISETAMEPTFHLRGMTVTGGPMISGSRQTNPTYNALAAQNAQWSLQHETFGGITDPSSEHVSTRHYLEMNPGPELGYNMSKIHPMHPIPMEMREAVGRRVKADFETGAGKKNLRNERKADSDYAGRDIWDEEDIYDVDEMFDPSKAYRGTGPVGASGKPAPRIAQRKPSAEALAGVSRARPKGKAQRYQNAARAGITDPTIKGVLPQGTRTTSNAVPYDLPTDPDNVYITLKQTGAIKNGQDLMKSLEGHYEDRFQQLADNVPQINNKIGGRLVTTESFVQTRGPNKGKKVTREIGKRYQGESAKKFQEIAQPWEQILASEGLAPLGGTNTYLGGYRNTNDIAGTSSEATGYWSAREVQSLGSWDDDSWKTKQNRRPTGKKQSI